MLRRQFNQNHCIAASAKTTTPFFFLFSNGNNLPSSSLLVTSRSSYHFRTSSKSVASVPDQKQQQTARELEEEIRKQKVQAYKQKIHWNVREMFLGMIVISGLFIVLISVAGTMMPKPNAM